MDKRVCKFMQIDRALAPARERSLRKIRDVIASSRDGTAPSEPVIPVDAQGWETVLVDAGITNKAHELFEALSLARALDVNAPSIIGNQLRRSLMQAFDVFDGLLHSIEQLSWFVPPVGQERDRHLTRLISASANEAISGLIEVLTSAGVSASDEEWRKKADNLIAFADKLADRSQVERKGDDVVALVFGAPSEQFTDRRGVIDSSRIRAFFAHRPEALEAISRRMLTSLIGDADVPPPDAAVYAASFALSERPLICHEVARETLSEISHRFAADPDSTAEALARRFEGVKNSASTHFHGIVPTATRREEALSGGEQARLSLELFRLASEGPLRQTGWSYLELRGHPARRAPSLSKLRELLVADGSRLGRLIANGIHTEWRNPSAHEEHHWDSERECIVVAERTATVAEIDSATGYALSVMQGFETGLACARLLDDELARRLDMEPAVREPPLVDMRIRSDFARQGLLVWDTEWRSGEVKVIVEDDLNRNLHHVLAGTLGAAFETTSRVRWQIKERYGDHLLDISPEAIQAARKLLPRGAVSGQIDVNVLLPLVASFKISNGESAADVALDVTRLALKHPLGIAQDYAKAIILSETAAVTRLVDALDVSELALKATWDLVGDDGDQQRVRAHLKEALAVTKALSRGNRAQFMSLKHHLNSLYETYHALPDRPLRCPVENYGENSDRSRPYPENDRG